MTAIVLQGSSTQEAIAVDTVLVLLAALFVGFVVTGVSTRILVWALRKVRPQRRSGSAQTGIHWELVAAMWTLASLVPLSLLPLLVWDIGLWGLFVWGCVGVATAWPILVSVGLDARRVRKTWNNTDATGETSVFEFLKTGLNTKARREGRAEFKRARPLTFWALQLGWGLAFSLIVPHLAVVVATWYLLWARPRALGAERRYLGAGRADLKSRAAERKRTAKPATDRPHPVKADGRSATAPSASARPSTTEPTPDDLYGLVVRMREKGERAAETGRYDDALDAWQQAIDLCERAADATDSPDVIDDFRRLRAKLESSVEATERRKAASELEAAEKTARDALAMADGLLEDGSFADATEVYKRARGALVRLGALGEDLDRKPTIDVEASLERVERGRIEAVLGGVESRIAEGETALEAGDANEAIAVFEEVLDGADGLDDTGADGRLAPLTERASVGRITAAARNQIDSMIQAETLFEGGNPFQAREHYRRIESAITTLAPSAREYPEVYDELRAIADACEWNVDVTRRAIWEDDDRALVTAEDVRNGWRPPAPKTTVDAVMAALDGYSLTAQLGGGGFADVYEVRSDDGSQAALKIPRMQFDETVPESKIRLFDAEAENWRAVSDHPNVVDVLGYGDKPVPWLLLERCAESLRGRLESLSSEEALEVIVGIGGALDHANGKGIVHLDVKPENVLFDGEGVPKLGDWGLSKVVVDGTITTPGLSNRYAAPEQLDRTLGPRNVRTDVYQYGVLAYELLTGEHPFEVGSRDSLVLPTELQSDLPESVDTTLLKALAYDQTERYEQVVQVRDALTRALGVEA